VMRAAGNSERTDMGHLVWGGFSPDHPAHTDRASPIWRIRHKESIQKFRARRRVARSGQRHHHERRL
jgi:hypothetical protein